MARRGRDKPQPLRGAQHVQIVGPRRPDTSAMAAIANVSEPAALADTLTDALRPPVAAEEAAMSFELDKLERERLILETALVAETRELALQDFWFFMTHVLFPTVWEKHYLETFHKPILDRLQGLLAKPTSNLMLVLPRESRKSFIVFAFVIWLILRDPDIRIMIVSAKEKMAGRWVTLIRDAFMEGSLSFLRLHQVFPDYVIPRKAKVLLQAFQFTHPLRRKAVADPTVHGTYLGVTGAGGRADVQIFDDPYERRNVSNPVQSLKALQQTLDLFPLVEKAEQSPYRLRLFCVTRWAYHDPTGYFLGDKENHGAEIDGAPIFDAIVRHSFEDPNIPCQVCPPHILRAHPHGNPDLAGEAIMHPIITRQGLMTSYAEYASDPEKGESLWFHQYQNVCLAPKSQKIKPDWLLTAHFAVFPAPILRVISIDSADKDFQKEGVGDYMVAMMGEFDDFGRLLLVHALYNRHWTRAEFIRRVITWCKGTNWWPSSCAKEKFGDDTFLTDLRQALLNEFKPCHMVLASRPTAVTGLTFMKKLDWIVHALQGPLERAEIVLSSVFPKELGERLKYELGNLGQIKHDDLADCLAVFFAKGVRPTVSRAPFMGGAAPQPPGLDLYNATPVALGATRPQGLVDVQVFPDA